MRLLIILSLAVCLAGHKSNAVRCNLDLKGDGEYSEVDLPFSYYQRPAPLQEFDYVSQGAYIKYEKNKVAATTVLIGPLNPCIGVVATNGEHVMAFHVHWSNDLNDMSHKIEACFGSMDSVLVRIFTADDGPLEWKKRKDDIAHNVATPLEVVKRVKDSLVNRGTPKNQISAQMYKLRDKEEKRWYSPEFLGSYVYAETWVAVNPEEIFRNTTIIQTGSLPKNLMPLYSIDPLAEDVFNLRNQLFGPQDIFDEDLPLETEEQRRAANERCKFFNLPLKYKRIIYYKKLQEIEDNLYQTYFEIENTNTLFKVKDDKKKKTLDKRRGSLAFVPVISNSPPEEEIQSKGEMN